MVQNFYCQSNYRYEISVGTKNDLQTHQNQIVDDCHGDIILGRRQYGFSFRKYNCDLILYTDRLHIWEFFKMK